MRPGELRGARWDEIDEDKATWRIPVHRMKMRHDHIIPLSKQSLVILQDIRKISGRTELLFPSHRDIKKSISDVTLLKAFQIMGYIGPHKIVPHGMRGTASTILNEHGHHRDAIERQLAHVEKNKVRAAYHHSEYLAERKAMMQWYADHLDKLKAEDAKKSNNAQAA